MRKFLLLCGALGAVIYVVTVILGGVLRPEYSHVSQPISELVAASAPNRSLLSSLFIVYNVLIGTFGVGLFLNAKAGSRGRKLGMAGALALVAVGLAGMLLELFFPQDPGGARAPTTTTGTMHIVVAGIAALGTMLAVLLLALWFRNDPRMKRYVAYSLITVSVILVSGGLGASAASGSGGSPVFGLVERITIGAFIQWLFVVGLKMYSAVTPETERRVSPAG
ncbi:MAG: DUF998 domain-containing protein [Chloroflexi bacterium]|nr:DUF998 domain-containing protein [Chloroflexota bacterium]